MSETTQELIDLHAPIAKYSPIRKALDDLRKQYGKVLFDVTTREGMEQAKKARQTIREPRYEVERLRKALKAPALEYSRRIDDEAKAITKALRELEDPIDEQIKHEEQRAEREAAERLQKINAEIDEIRFLPVYVTNKTPDEILTIIAELEAKTFDPDLYGEHLTSAVGARTRSLQELRQAHDAKIEQIKQAELLAKQEAELAELRRLQAEQQAKLEQEKKAELAAAEPVEQIHSPEPEPEPVIEAVTEPVAAPEWDEEDPFASLSHVEPVAPAVPKYVFTREQAISTLANAFRMSQEQAEARLIDLFSET